MKTFPHWRAVGRAMLDARRREGVTVKPGGDWRSGDTRVIVTDSRRGLIIDLPEGRYLDTGHLDAGQVLRVLAALGLVPNDIAYADDAERYGKCTVCDRLAQWSPPVGDFAARWCHLDPTRPYHKPEVAS